MKTFSALAPAVLLLLLTACMATPLGPPRQIGSEIVVALDAGNEDQAVDLFSRATKTGGARDLLYPVLFDDARGRYEAGEAEGAARILRFMRDRYPDARAVREALVYALFLERSNQAGPAPELSAQLARELEAVDGRSPWVDLVRTQHSIDRGSTDDARVSFERFVSRWDGEPAQLMPYVEDLDRYLASH